MGDKKKDNILGAQTRLIFKPTIEGGGGEPKQNGDRRVISIPFFMHEGARRRSFMALPEKKGGSFPVTNKTANFFCLKECMLLSI